MFSSIFINYHVSGVVIKLINSSGARTFQIQRCLLGFSKFFWLCASGPTPLCNYVGPLGTLHLEGGMSPVLGETHAEELHPGKKQVGAESRLFPLIAG